MEGNWPKRIGANFIFSGSEETIPRDAPCEPTEGLNDAKQPRNFFVSQALWLKTVEKLNMQNENNVRWFEEMGTSTTQQKQSNQASPNWDSTEQMSTGKGFENKGHDCVLPHKQNKARNER